MVEYLKTNLGLDIPHLISMAVPVIVTFIICLVSIKVIMKFVKKILKKAPLEKGLTSFLEKVIKFILYFIVILIVADMVSIPITSLLATFSVVGLAASLAIQDALGNLASGVMILATKPFKSGDYIEGAAVSGTVSEINFSHTLLVTPDNKQIHVPNKEIINSTITNYSEQQFRRVDITYNLEYSADAAKAKDIMREAVEKHPKVLQDRPIFVKTTAFKESGIDYTLRVWVNSCDYWEVYFDLLEGIKETFDKNGIDIAYNRLNVKILDK
jgi:small conductance mechanosensitive channel